MKTFRNASRRAARRTWLAALIITLSAALLSPALSSVPVNAQGGVTGRTLSVGDVVTGTLDSQNYVQVFNLPASAGDTITIDVSTEVEALAPTVIVTDARGNPIAQDNDIASPLTATLADVVLPTNGTYYILVMRGSGAEGDASGQFTLRLSGIQQVGGQSVNLPNGGITVELAWNAAVNLNLEVRDPVGGTVHAFSPGSPSGGTLDADVNEVCASAIGDNPTETVAWPAGDVPAGSYEIIIYYFDACDVGGSQVFTLSAEVNGEAAQSVVGTLIPGQQYLSRLVVDADGTWTLVNGGVNAGLDITLFRNQIASADSIAVGSTVSGLITNASPARVYTFDAAAGSSVNISLQAQTGSLDTYLVLLGPDSTPVADNDDRDETTTDSAISRTLAADGTYTIIATRYGLTIGGTEGEFTLTVTTSDLAEVPTGEVTEPGEPTAEAGPDLPGGAIEVQLTWNTNADLQLLVRDPLGAAVFDDIPTISSGGVLYEDGNVGCVDTTTDPLSYIYWPTGRLQPGIYEVEIWYQNTCDDTSPVNFVLEVGVQGESVINTAPQLISPNSRYMVTFKIEPDLTVTAGPGGFFDMANASSLNYQAQLATATPITYQQIVTGSITEQQRFVVYSFEGETGDTVTIGMNVTGNTLDPALYLISPEGIQIDYNDDVTPGENPNSVISEVTLPSNGTYYIIATHYGLNYGGTQGTYELTLVQE